MSRAGERGRLRARFRGWLRTGAERVPIRWFTIAATGVLLAATAAFGGLDTAAKPAPAEIAAGEQFLGTPVAFTPQRAVLIDALPEAGATPGAGERVLAIIVDAEVTWESALQTSDPVFLASLRLADLPEEPPNSVARPDDGTLTPTLQPGVPANLVLTWLVDEQRFTEGDSLPLVLQNSTASRGQYVVYGVVWSDPEPAARVALTVEDVGAGASEEDGS